MGITAPEPLTPEHITTGFACGEPALDVWLEKRALANHDTGAFRVFVTCVDKVVIGYYALAVGSVERSLAAGAVRRNMPDPIPAMILGRLAVSAQHQGQGIGPGLLKDAVLRTLAAAEHAGIRALLVHAISARARDFYLQHGFRPSPVDDMTLMISLQEARDTLA